LAPCILGVAKIVSGGTTYIRGYGTFPHPNPFSAFLVAGILITIYLLTLSASKKQTILYSTLLFINILGLTVTFSRGAYLSLAAGLVIFFGIMCFIPLLAKEGLLVRRSFSEGGGGVNKRRSFAIIITLISIVISFFLFKPFLLTRATFSDQSTIERKFYDVTGIKMAVANPIFGVGIGESLLHMEQYSGRALAPWDKQPPHNYFIIAAAEMGIPAMLILIWFFLANLLLLLKKIRGQPSYILYSLFSILLSFFLLMLFDHYFYTLNQTQLLLWIFLALIAAQTKNPSDEGALKS
jgi:O-antigen ligase